MVRFAMRGSSLIKDMYAARILRSRFDVEERIVFGLSIADSNVISFLGKVRKIIPTKNGDRISKSLIRDIF
jgi:hypothetical protein